MDGWYHMGPKLRVWSRYKRSSLWQGLWWSSWTCPTNAYFSIRKIDVGHIHFLKSCIINVVHCTPGQHRIFLHCHWSWRGRRNWHQAPPTKHWRLHHHTHHVGQRTTCLKCASSKNWEFQNFHHRLSCWLMQPVASLLRQCSWILAAFKHNEIQAVV